MKELSNAKVQLFYSPKLSQLVDTYCETVKYRDVRVDVFELSDKDYKLVFRNPDDNKPIVEFITSNTGDYMSYICNKIDILLDDNN